jgi:hypothetical protein
VEANLVQNVLFPGHLVESDRERTAAACVRNLNLSIPVLLDDMADSADTLYRGWPERLYVIDSDGRIVYQGAKGPYGFDPEEIYAVLSSQLPTDSAPA